MPLHRFKLAFEKFDCDCQAIRIDATDLPTAFVAPASLQDPHTSIQLVVTLPSHDRCDGQEAVGYKGRLEDKMLCPW